MANKAAVPPAKERLTRERIADCALALADAEGLEAVTIRRLAQDQGVTPMALYWHFKDKELLLDGVTERLLSEVTLRDREVAAADPWPERLGEVLRALLEVLRAHPAVASLVPLRILGSEQGLELSERAFGALAEGGFEADQRAQIGMHALQTMVLLVTAQPGQPVGNESDELNQQRMRAKKADLQRISPERYPNVILCADDMTESPDDAAYFELGLNLILEGIRGVRGVQPSRPSR